MVDLSKRSLLGAPFLASALAPAVAKASEPACAPDAPFAYDLPMAPGPFQPTAESLSTYQTPEWFRDAKFGIWAHWGPQAVPRQGDWYARQMYIPGHPHYEHHLKTYGHPSKVGYKDIIPLWKAEKFDPDALMDLYVQAGAKYFVSMGVHHDNFDLWESKHHRWNAVKIGPKRDIVGNWRTAALKRGLRFGVSEHLGASYAWYAPSHNYDQLWPELGVGYDGENPEFQDLYHPKNDEPFRSMATWYAKSPAWRQTWFNRVRDLLDRYQPDLLYSDGGLPFENVGRTLLAHYYNANRAAHGGKLEAVYNHKDIGSGEFIRAAGVQDVERGVMNGINPAPWQTDTSIGDWFYSEGYKYKSTAEVVTMLADIVSKNGNLLLNVVLYPEGDLPPESKTFLSEMAAWMRVNGEAIHGTRPWKIFGEGPSQSAGGAFNEDAVYSGKDIRFTVKAGALYAITLGTPEPRVAITALGRRAGLETRRVAAVHQLGAPHPLSFEQTDAALTIHTATPAPVQPATVFKVSFKG